MFHFYGWSISLRGTPPPPYTVPGTCQAVKVGSRPKWTPRSVVWFGSIYSHNRPTAGSEPTQGIMGKVMDQSDVLLPPARTIRGRYESLVQ